MILVLFGQPCAAVTEVHFISPLLRCVAFDSLVMVFACFCCDSLRQFWPPFQGATQQLHHVWVVAAHKIHTEHVILERLTEFVMMLTSSQARRYQNISKLFLDMHKLLPPCF